MRVVIVGRPSDRQRVRAGLTESGLEVLGEAVTLAAARDAYPSADAFIIAPTADLDDSDQDDSDQVDAEPLTPRELDVVHLLALGLPNKAIARRLGISDQTVKFHIASILGKLGAANRTDAVRRAVRRGIVDL
jgi:DNA-binding NarL/FixJ family response regulator